MTLINIKLTNYEPLLELLKKANTKDLKTYLSNNFGVKGGFDHKRVKVIFKVPDNNYKAVEECILGFGGVIEVL